MKVYIKVKASEELPEAIRDRQISEDVFVKSIVDLDAVGCYSHRDNKWHIHDIGNSDKLIVEYWLKEIELPDVTIEPVINMDKVITSEPDMIKENQSKPSGK